MDWKINQKGIDILTASEGKYNHAYKCPANKWTICYGHTKGVREGDYANDSQCERMLKEDLKETETYINKLKLNINENQFSALVSFTYNVGVGNLMASTLLKKIRINPNDESIKLEFAKWNRGGGKVLPGLTIRRCKEMELYFI